MPIKKEAQPRLRVNHDQTARTPEAEGDADQIDPITLFIRVDPEEAKDFRRASYRVAPFVRKNRIESVPLPSRCVIGGAIGGLPAGRAAASTRSRRPT